MEADIIETFGSYMPWKVDEKTWIIQFMSGSQYMYLLEGNDKALLLDTGWGTGNLRELAEKLTNKPILVANTHFHPDHNGGNGEFEEVYLSKNFEMEQIEDVPGLCPCDISKLPHPDYQKKFIGEGYIFELGNRSVEVMEALPAHCNSSLFFLDKGHRMVFTGDEFESMQSNLFNDPKDEKGEVLDALTVMENFTANAKRIWELRDYYDFVMPCHNGSPISKHYIEQASHILDAIRNGEASIEEKLNHKFIEMDPKAPLLCRVRYKDVSIFAYKSAVKELMG